MAEIALSVLASDASHRAPTGQGAERQAATRKWRRDVADRRSTTDGARIHRGRPTLQLTPGRAPANPMRGFSGSE